MSPVSTHRIEGKSITPQRTVEKFIVCHTSPVPVATCIQFPVTFSVFEFETKISEFSVFIVITIGVVVEVLLMLISQSGQDVDAEIFQGFTVGVSSISSEFPLESVTTSPATYPIQLICALSETAEKVIVASPVPVTLVRVVPEVTDPTVAVQ